MKKILFLIHDLGQGGAEKVLVNLANHMDRSKFDVTVIALFGGGVNERFLKEHVRYRSIFPKSIPGNSRLMKLLSPGQLHRWFIKEKYDIEVSYLEGPSARIVSGCPHPDTRLVCWIHTEQKTPRIAAASFRSVREAARCYNRFHHLVGVSETVKADFLSLLPISAPMDVLYNTNETGKILDLAREPVEDGMFSPDEIKLVGVGKLLKKKGFDRLLRIHKRLREEGYPVHTYILGEGPERGTLEGYISRNALHTSVTLLGYRTNPYPYVAKCDLFVCVSFAEGFSTAATEALIVGTPVCTVEVSGMKEMLGAQGEYGVITANDEDSLYHGLKGLLDEPERLAHYANQARIRGRAFETKQTVSEAEELLLSL